MVYRVVYGGTVFSATGNSVVVGPSQARKGGALPGLRLRYERIDGQMSGVRADPERQKRDIHLSILNRNSED